MSWRNRILASTWVAYAGYYFCRKTFYVAKSSLRDELGFSTIDLGNIGMAYLLAYTIGQFASAALGPKVGARVLLLGGAALSIVANIAFGFSNSPATFLVFMALNGFAQSAGWPSVIGTLAAWTTRKERGTLMGFWATCYQIGSMAAKAWAALWLGQLGFRYSFFAGSAVLVLAALVVFLWQRNRPEDVDEEPFVDEETSQEEEDIGWTRPIVVSVLLVGVFYFGVKFVRYALWSWAPILLEDTFGVTKADAGYLSIIFDAAGFVGVIFAGVASDKLFAAKRAGIALLMILGMLGGCGLLYSVGLTSLVAFGACLGLIGFMLYGPDALLTGAGAIDVGNKRTALAAAGIINGMGSAGSVLQELVVSRIIDDSTETVLLALVAASVLSALALVVVLLRNRFSAHAL